MCSIRLLRTGSIQDFCGQYLGGAFRPIIICNDRDVVPPRGLFTYGVGLTAGTSFFCEPGATLEVIGAAASSAAALSFVRGPASIFVALIAYVMVTFAPTFNSPLTLVCGSRSISHRSAPF